MYAEDHVNLVLAILLGLLLLGFAANIPKLSPVEYVGMAHHSSFSICEEDYSLSFVYKDSRSVLLKDSEFCSEGCDVKTGKCIEP